MERSFSMRKKKKPFLPKVFITILMAAAITGAILFFSNTTKESELTDKTVVVRSEATKSDSTLNKNSITKIKTLYRCGHEKNETQRTEEKLIGKTKREVELLRPQWRIINFTPDGISAEIDSPKECGKHFLIRLVGNKLTVFKTDDTSIVIKEKEIDLAMLSEEDIDILLNGIRAETEFEMLEILESFSE